LGTKLTKGIEASAFRAQLVVPEQRQLYDYWLQKAGSRKMPTRADISPAAIPRLLPGLSLVDVNSEIPKSRVRLAGTRLREIYDREITGQMIDELDWGDKRDYWMTSYRRAVESGLPTQGVLKGPRNHKEHLVQYWLKLPLACAEGVNVAMLLCFDSFIPVSESLENQQRLVSA
jgi:hypothetical protein